MRTVCAEALPSSWIATLTESPIWDSKSQIGLSGEATTVAPFDNRRTKVPGIAREFHPCFSVILPAAMRLIGFLLHAPNVAHATIKTKKTFFIFIFLHLATIRIFRNSPRSVFEIFLTTQKYFLCFVKNTKSG